MKILCKQFKNVFAKKVFLPFLFIAFFIFSFSLLNIFTSFQKIKIFANSFEQNYLNTQQKDDSKIVNADISMPLVNMDNIPTEYSLFNIKTIIDNFSLENKGNNENLIKNVGTQKGTSICWAFASLTALETTLYKSGIIQANETLNFSELNMAYVSQVVNRNRATVSGGNFDLAYEYLSSEYGPVYEQEGEGYNSTNQSRWATDSSVTSFYSTNFYNSSQKANYRVLEAMSFPDKNTLETDEEKTNLRLAIKNHILTYGGVTSSIYMDSSNLLLYNQTYICTNANLKQNHMVTLVGWDDDYTATIGGKTYVGAYIVQNSAGTNFGMNGYFYIMYDDAFVENDVNGFTRVGVELDNTINYNNLKETSVNNKFLTYHSSTSGSGETSYNIKTITDDFYATNIYKKENVSNQFISRLKIPTSYNNKSSKFYVYVLDGLTGANIISSTAINSYLSSNFSTATQVENKFAEGDDKYLFIANQATYYTIDLKDNIYISGEYFAIIIKYVSGSVLQLSNDDSSLSQAYQFTYKSTNAMEWSSYYTSDNKLSILPMIVQMQYDLGTIDYSYENVKKEYDGKNANIKVNVLTDCDYQIYYNLTNNINEWTTTVPTVKNSGEYDICFKIVADFYETIEDVINVQIDKKDITVVAISDQKVYGEGDPILSYSYTGNYETPSFSGRLSRESGENVGSYKITIGSLKLNSNSIFNQDNYNLVFDSAEVYFNIIQRELYITPNLTSKIYGDNDPEEFTYLYTNIATGEIPGFNGLLSRETGENVGNYDIILNTLTLKDNLAEDRTKKDFISTNYKLVLQNFNNKFVINKRDLIITPQAHQSKIYGESDPVFTYNYSNNVNGEIPVFSGNLSRIAGEDAGNYNYLIGTLKLNQSDTLKEENYNLVLNSKDRYFAITFGELEGCSVNNIKTIYDGNYYFVTPSNSIYNDVNFSFSLDKESWVDKTIKIKNAGIHNVFVKFSKDNYSDTILTATIEIETLELVVTPIENQTKVYGEQNEEIKFNYSGNLQGETPKFTGMLSREIDLTSSSFERVGEYLINKGNLALDDNNTFLAENYVLKFNSNNITFAIVPREIKVIPNANQFKYYNTSDNVISYSFEGNMQGETPTFLGTLEREPGENVGNYKIKLGSLEMQDNGNFKSHNYVLKITEDSFLEILPAKIIVKIENKQIYYPEEPITEYPYDILNFSNTTGSYKEGDNLNITFICLVNDTGLKGAYKVSCKASNENYEIIVQEAIYEIYYHVKFIAYNEEIKSFTAEHFYTLNNEDFPKVETKEGYVFANWLVQNSNGTFSIISDNFVVTSNTTIVAFIGTQQYTINYVINGGTFNPLVTSYTIETQDFYLNNPIKQGYTFLGWYLSSSLTGTKITKIERGSTGDITLYAKYEINTYDISFKKDENLPYSVVYEGKPVIEYNNSFKFSIILKSGYTQSYNKMKVYAKKVINTKSLDSKELNKKENNIVFKKMTEEDDIIELIRNEEGYYIIDNIFCDYEIFCENITLNSYSIFFLIDDYIIKQIRKSHGSSLSFYEFPEIPEKEHYNDTMPYWNMGEIESVIKDETIIAKYVPNVHTITFVMPDGKTYTANVNYGENVSTKILEENYHLGVFNYFVFNSSLNNITGDKTIKVAIYSNVFILYIVLACVAMIVIVIVSVTLIKKRKRDTFNWWIYTKRK